MILEAFAKYLQAADPRKPATEVLAQWLLERLTAQPRNNVDRVVHAEMSLWKSSRGEGDKTSTFDASGTPDLSTVRFTGRSPQGKVLLKSLYEYCLSYDSQKWSRFVHNLKASDFVGRQVDI
ncbi:MAG TPA: hypothetical protein V6C76_08075 [Drouetiella sp.]